MVLLVTANAYADNMLFRGNLIIPSCKLKHDIQVDWGDIEIQSLKEKNTSYHPKEVRIDLTCPYFYKTPKLKVIADRVENRAGIKTSKYNEGLVVFLSTKTGEEWINTNEYFNIPEQDITGEAEDKVVHLYAWLGRYNEITDLTPGEWNAIASMEVRYE